MQEKFIGFKHPITSFGANKKYSGILDANVYRGFDVVSGVNGLTFNLDHSLTGEVFTNQDLSLSNRLGVWMTRQGVVIKEDAAIPLTILTNAGNNAQRIDLLIGRHNHDILQVGGINASYEIIKGGNGGPTIPNIPNPETATVLGSFLLAPNASAMSNITWQRNRTPGLGGFIPALLGEDNRYTAQQQLQQQLVAVQIDDIDYEITHRGSIAALNKGNLFSVASSFNFLDLLPNKPNGTVISLKFEATVTIRGFLDNLQGGIQGIGVRAGYANGFRPISLENKISSLPIPAGAVVTFQKMDSQLNWSPGATPPQYEYGDFWKVMLVSSNAINIRDIQIAIGNVNALLSTHTTQIAALTTAINNINPPRLLQDIDYVGTMNNDFDATGLAKPTSPYYGRAICNGQNATPDMRARFKVSYSDSDSDYNSVGLIGGGKWVTLNVNQLPSFNVKTKIGISRTGWRTSDGTGNPVVAINNQGGGPSLNEYDTNSTFTGLNQGIDIRPPYRTVLTLMWVGIP